MTEKKLCSRPGCNCGFEEYVGEDEIESYCKDDKSPILCEIPEKKCKYPEVNCLHKNYYANDEDEENPICEAIREGIDECPLKVYEPDGETWSLQETIIKSPHWNLKGFQYYKDKLLVDEKIIRAISSWAGDCTEPNSGIYNNPEAMFNALNLIYKLIDECEESPVTIENKPFYGDDPETVNLSRIISFNTHEKRFDDPQEVEK